jgi:hypothetical protein
MRPNVLTLIAILSTAPVLFASNQFAKDVTTDCAQKMALFDATGTPAAATELPLTHFGIGIGAETRTGSGERVTDAAIVNGKVTVLASQNTSAGPILEAHALAFPIFSKWAVKSSTGKLIVTEEQPCSGASRFPIVALGPFGALRVGDSQIIQSFGAGLMCGFRMKESDMSLNLGVAYMLQPQVKTLASGYQDGQAPPAGETAVRYKTESGHAIAFVLSFGW